MIGAKNLHRPARGCSTRAAYVQPDVPVHAALRNLGQAGEAAALLFEELRASSDKLDGAVRAFLALALGGLGREREAIGISLTALSKHLPQYNRSLARYASEPAADPRR